MSRTTHLLCESFSLSYEEGHANGESLALGKMVSFSILAPKQAFVNACTCLLLDRMAAAEGCTIAFATFHFLALPLSSCFQCPRPSLRLTSDLFIEELG